MSTYPLKNPNNKNEITYRSNYPLHNKKQNKEIVIFSLDSFDTIVKNNIKNKLRLSKWDNIKSTFENTAGYFATGQDLVFISNLANYLYGSNSSIVVKNYSGAPHIIITGSPAIRLKIKGVANLLPTPTVAKFAVGTEAALSSIKSGGIITIVLMSSYRVLDYFLSDKQTLSILLGSIASDIIKVGLASAVTAIIVNTAATAAGAVVTMTAGPLFAAVIISLAVGAFLNAQDKEKGLTQKLINTIENQIFYLNKSVNDIAEREYNSIQKKAKTMHFSKALSRGLL